MGIRRAPHNPGNWAEAPFPGNPGTQARETKRSESMKNVAILLNPIDNVATALKDLQAGESIQVVLDEVSYSVILREDIPFGHKYALRDISTGSDVLKYGLPIGRALQDIRAGDWVHVHNCRSDRYGFRHEQYGIRA